VKNLFALDRRQIDTIAQGISLAFHPLVIVIPTMILSMYWTGTTLLEAIKWTVIAIIMVNLPGLLVLRYGLRKGSYSDPSVSIREQRPSVYFFGVLFLVALTVALYLGKSPKVLIACLLAALSSSVIGYLINKQTKISLHTIAIGGCTTVFLLINIVVGIVMVFISVAVAWSRIRLNHHTLIQVIMGWALAAISVVTAFKLML
jgi:membrane-associated phospholipid phosphatase